MRKLRVCVAVLSVWTVAGHAAQEPPRSSQAFQTRIDLITVDVAAVDGKGRPVEDLRARDFTVKVDGKGRDVVSAELVKVDRSVADPSLESSTPSLVTTNAVTPGGRLIAIGIDQTLIVPGSIKPLLGSASRFVDGLTARDHVALITFPEPGPRVDFTLDHPRPCGDEHRRRAAGDGDPADLQSVTDRVDRDPRKGESVRRQAARG